MSDYTDTLQLAVNEGLAINEADELVRDVPKLVGYCKKFPSATTALELARRRLKEEKLFRSILEDKMEQCF